MCKLITVKVSEFLNRKFLEWQLESGERKTIEGFASLLGAKQAIVSMWLNGTRNPGPQYKERIIELFGREAIEAFGDDPDLYLVTQQWDKLPNDVRRGIVEQAKKQVSKNGTRRIHQKRATRTAE